MKVRLFFASSALLVAVIACSGAETTELFDPVTTSNGTNPSGSSGSSSSSSSSGSGASGTSSGSPTSSGGPGSPGSSSGTSGNTSSGNTTIDAGTNPPPNNGTIFCGDNPPCPTATDVCCVSLESGIGTDQNPAYECKKAGLLPCLGTNKFACDDTTDCPSGQICCGSFDQSGTHGSTECRTASQCKSQGSSRVGILCDPSAAPDQCSGFGMACEESVTLPGYYVCRD